MSAASSVVDVSLFNLLRSEFGDTLQPMLCTKATLVHLSHTLEDIVLSQRIPALLFTGFQESSHWREETERYRALAEVAQQVCIFAGGNLPPESSAREVHVTLRGDDPLRQEWFVVLLCSEFAVLLCGQDRRVSSEEATRQFETLWSFEPAIIDHVLDLLEQVIVEYRPERLAGLQTARTNFPLRDPAPKIVTAFTAEMIRFEEELHQSLHRTTQALNEQLRWRDDLTATLVHDMRSPLQGLAMSIEMLEMLDQFDQVSLLDLLAIAKRSTNNLQELVQVILDTNQLAVGQLTVAWQPIQPRLLIAQVLEPLQALIHGQSITVQVQIEDRVHLMWGDKALLGRVLQNLLTNAIKFTPINGVVSINISFAPTGDMLELRVRDTGEGISPAALPHIFERYYQAQHGDRRGTGLGLYFSALAAKAHGGSIRATSQLGNGTAITLLLPASPPLT